MSLTENGGKRQLFISIGDLLSGFVNKFTQEARLKSRICVRTWQTLIFLARSGCKKPRHTTEGMPAFFTTIVSQES